MSKVSRISLVSVVILNYNGETFLSYCIDSLLKQNYKNIEIIIIDNNSSDNSRKVAERFPVKFVPLDNNYGFSKANNIGATFCKGKYILFVNNDMRFKTDFIGSIVREIEKDEKIFAADAKQFDWSNENIMHGAVGLSKNSFLKGKFLPFIAEVQDYACNSVVDVPHACGSNIMVRADLFRSLNGFDETFFFDFEDVDICWRAWLMGYRSIYVPDAVAYHKVAASFRRDSQNETLKLQYIRRLSGRKNYLGFVLKTMPWYIVFFVFIRELLWILGFVLLKRNLKIAWSEMIAFYETVMNIRDSLNKRTKILSCKSIDSIALIKYFLNIKKSLII